MKNSIKKIVKGILVTAGCTTLLFANQATAQSLKIIKMKKTFLFVVFGILFFNPTFAQKYFGKSYPATQIVDEYYDIADVKKAHSVMGKTELSQSFRSLEKSQQKIIELAKSKGADGVIFSIVEEVYGTSNSSGGLQSDKKKNKKTVSSTSTTIDLKEKKIKATFVKYD